MKSVRTLCIAAFLVADGVVVYGQFGPCNITVPGGFTNTIACTGSIIPPLPDGCAGSQATVVQQKACANANSDPCANLPNNLLITRPALYVPTWIVGPCYGVRGGGVWSHDCVPGPAIVTPGGTNC